MNFKLSKTWKKDAEDVFHITLKERMKKTSVEDIPK
jgi:hypothetical protein